MRHARRITVLLLTVFGLVAAFVVPSGGVGATPAKTVSRQDAKWMRSNAHVDYAEIAIGQIAMDRSSDKAVLMLAEKTTADHQYALGLLQAVADKVGVTLPTGPNTQQGKLAAKLMKVSDEDFDVTYLTIQIAGHKKSIAGTVKEIQEGSDPDVVAFAKAYLPFAKMHLHMATRILKQMSS